MAKKKAATKMPKEKKPVGATSAALLKKPKPQKPRPKTKQKKGLPADRLHVLAAKHKPPQSWFEEDLDDI